MDKYGRIFVNEELGSIGVVFIEDKIYFVARDVASALGYESTGDFILRRVEQEDRIRLHESIPVPGSPPFRGGLILINESGLFSLVLLSTKPNAKKLKHWLTNEVLPAIYSSKVQTTSESLEKDLLNPDLLIKLATKLKNEISKNEALQDENDKLKIENQIMQPKAEYFDGLIDNSLLMSFRETAKELGIRQKRFISFLEENGYIYRDKYKKILPKNENDGLFKIKKWYNKESHSTGIQTLITPKGRESFRLLCSYLQEN